MLEIKYFLPSPLFLCRAAGRGGGGGVPPPAVGRSVNPIPSRGQIMPTILLLPPLPPIFERYGVSGQLNWWTKALTNFLIAEEEIFELSIFVTF